MEGSRFKPGQGVLMTGHLQSTAKVPFSKVTCSAHIQDIYKKKKNPQKTYELHNFKDKQQIEDSISGVSFYPVEDKII